jgi:hypothetical protein
MRTIASRSVHRAVPLAIGVIATCLSLSRPAALAAADTGVLAFGGFARTSLNEGQVFSPMDFATFGFGVETRLSRRFSLRVAPAYMPRGTTFAHRSTHLRHADYLEIPVLLGASLAPRVAVEPYLLAGPTLGIRLRGEEQVYYCWTPSWCEVVIDPSGFRRLDFGVALGGGIAFGRGAVRPFLEAQWQHGFVDLDPRSDEDAVFRTTAFVARAGVSWRPGAP